MRISTDDASFGLIVTPADEPWDTRFFRFQLIVGSVVIGDSEPCVLGSMMTKLQNLPRLEDPRLVQPNVEPAATIAVLRSDAALNDSSLLGAAESLDRWLAYGYIHDTTAVVLGEPAEMPAEARTISVAVVPQREFESIVRSAVRYWKEVQATT